VKYPGLIPFAALGDTMDAEATLRQVALKVDQVSDYDKKANLIAASAILAGLRLEDEVIYRVLRRDIMQESTVYRSIQREAEEARDRAIALNFLRQGVSVEMVSIGTGLSIEEVQQIQSQMNQPSPS
jgi:predicted transposase YdaD